MSRVNCFKLQEVRSASAFLRAHVVSARCPPRKVLGKSDIAKQIPRQDCGQEALHSAHSPELQTHSPFQVLSRGREYHEARIHSCYAHSTTVVIARSGRADELREQASRIAVLRFSLKPACRHQRGGRLRSNTKTAPTHIARRASPRAEPRLLRRQSHDFGFAARVRAASVDGDPASVRRHAARARRNVPRRLARSVPVPSGWAAGDLPRMQR